MASPFASSEPLTLEEPTQDQNSFGHEAKPKPKLPSELQGLVNKYSTLVENPTNSAVLWDYVQIYLTYLENNSQKLYSVLGGQGDNIMTKIKSLRNQNYEWSVFNIFLTLSNIGSEISQKETLTDDEKWYIFYVMLSFDNSNSITYDFTVLLQNLMSQNEGYYNELNDKFLKAFSSYESTPESAKSKQSLLSKKFTISGKNVDIKIIIAIVVILILVLAGGSYYYFVVRKQPGLTITKAASVSSGSSGSSGSSRHSFDS